MGTVVDYNTMNTDNYPVINNNGCINLANSNNESNSYCNQQSFNQFVTNGPNQQLHTIQGMNTQKQSRLLCLC